MRELKQSRQVEKTEESEYRIEGLNEADRRFRDSVIRNFIDREGRLKSIPAQLKKKLIILEHLVSGLDAERNYEESEINAYIRLYHDDYATLRREWIVQGFMSRDQEIYVRNPLLAARRWEELS
ncbi:transcriptional regulator [Saccharibacillus sp. O16]|nr:transcriptional regulator [Saccharibacillus sp. O16]